MSEMEADQATPFPRCLKAESAAAEAWFQSRWGLEAGVGQPASLSFRITAWHQHLDCRLLLLLSKVVLNGDGFLIEIQSIGTERLAEGTA